VSTVDEKQAPGPGHKSGAGEGGTVSFRFGREALVLLLLAQLSPVAHAEEDAEPTPGKHYPVNLSLYHPVSVNDSEHDSVNLNLSLAYGRVGHVSGLDVSLGASAVSHTLQGVQVCGLLGVAGESGQGVQASGLMSVSGERFAGFQASGLMSVAGERLSGFQAAGLMNVAGDRGEGLQLAGLANVGGDAFSGGQLAGGFSVAGERGAGFQVSGLFNVTGENLAGFQAAGLFNVTGEDLDGFQAAGLFVRGPPGRGGQPFRDLQRRSDRPAEPHPRGEYGGSAGSGQPGGERRGSEDPVGWQSRGCERRGPFRRGSRLLDRLPGLRQPRRRDRPFGRVRFPLRGHVP